MFRPIEKQKDASFTRELLHLVALLLRRRLCYGRDPGLYVELSLELGIRILNLIYSIMKSDLEMYGTLLPWAWSTKWLRLWSKVFE
jgi:hypothetical protein